MMKVLLVRLGALGDIVHGLPVAAAVRDAWPDARIDWLVDARHAAVLAHVTVVDRAVAVDGRSAGGMLSAIRALRRERYDAAIDLQGLVKSALLARLSGAARVVGFDRSSAREAAASFFYSARVRPAGAVHVVDRNLSLLRALGIDAPRRRFPIEASASAAAGPVVERAAREGRSGFALLNPGAGWPNKRWPPERFGATAAWMAGARGLLPVVLWGPGEEALAAEVVAASKGTAMLAPPTGVADVLALARRARLMLSGDTGPLHLAAAVGAPVVALFGPTDPARNGPWCAEDVSVSRHGACDCRYRRRCRRRQACIEEIAVEDVCEAIDRRLAAAARHD